MAKPQEPQKRETVIPQHIETDPDTTQLTLEEKTKLDFFDEKMKKTSVMDVANVLLSNICRDVMVTDMNMQKAKRDFISWYSSLSEEEKKEHSSAIRTRADRMRIFAEALHQEIQAQTFAFESQGR